MFNQYTFGIDRFSGIFTLVLLVIIPTVYTINLVHATKLETLLSFILFVLLIITFYSLKLIIFYILFEIITLIMFILILFYGGSVHKLKAAYLFLIYSLFSSILLLQSFFLYSLVSDTYLTNFIIKFASFCLILAFIIKLPLVPFHSWLIEAHAEASTMGSIFLASGILKLAVYGIYRFLLNDLLPYLKLGIIVLAAISALYIVITLQRLVDFKQIIASSSIVHMSLGIIGLCSDEELFKLGGILILLHHSLLSCYLFFCAGSIKQRIGSLDTTLIKGINRWGGYLGFFLLIGFLINIGFPTSFAFISEVILLLGAINSVNIIIISIIVIVTLLSTCYSFWLIARITFTEVTVNISKNLNLNNNLLTLPSDNRLFTTPLVILSLMFLFITIEASAIILNIIVLI